MYLLYKYVKKKKAAKKAAAANGGEKPQASAPKSQHVKSLHEIVQAAQTATLTTRSADGAVTQCGMIPASAFDEGQTILTFFGDSALYNFGEIPEKSHVNLAFADAETPYNASYIGTATVSADPRLIAQYWSNASAAWYGQGVAQNDRRVVIIQVAIRPDSGSVDKS